MIYTLKYWGKRCKNLSFNRWKLSMVGLRMAYFYPIPKQENNTITGIHGTVIWTLRMAWPQMWLCLSVEVAARAPAVDVAGVMCGPGAKGFKAYLPRRLTIRWRKTIAISLSQCVRYVYVVYVYIYIYMQYMIYIYTIYDIWLYIYILYYIYIHYACTDQMPQDRHFHRNDMTTVTRAAATGNLHCSCRGFSRVVTRWIKLALMWFHGIFS